jgi:hypothetical protein
MALPDFASAQAILKGCLWTTPDLLPIIEFDGARIFEFDGTRIFPARHELSKLLARSPLVIAALIAGRYGRISRSRNNNSTLNLRNSEMSGQMQQVNGTNGA